MLIGKQSSKNSFSASSQDHEAITATEMLSFVKDLPPDRLLRRKSGTRIPAYQPDAFLEAVKITKVPVGLVLS
jgi:hypothetical protein